MKLLLKSITCFFAAVLLISSVGHIVSPELSTGFIPQFLPVTPVHIAAAIVECALAIGLVIPTTRKWAFLGFFLLMLIFLPLHVLDLFQDKPVIGSFPAAVVRVVIQIVLIGSAWWGWKKSEHLRP